MYSKEIVMMGRPIHMLTVIRAAALAMLVVLSAAGAAAQNTGKIAGTVKDRATGEALVGANVAVKGTALGASTDVEGRFFILRVPPGIHDLAISSVGYQGITLKGRPGAGGSDRRSAGEAGAIGHRGGRRDGHGRTEDGPEGRHLDPAYGVAGTDPGDPGS